MKIYNEEATTKTQHCQINNTFKKEEITRLGSLPLYGNLITKVDRIHRWFPRFPLHSVHTLCKPLP